MTTNPPQSTRFDAWVFKVAPSVCFVLAGFIFNSADSRNAEEHKRIIARLETLEVKSAEHDIKLAVITSKDATEGKN